MIRGSTVNAAETKRQTTVPDQVDHVGIKVMVMVEVGNGIAGVQE